MSQDPTTSSKVDNENNPDQILITESRECLIPLEIMRNTLAAGIVSLEDESKHNYKPSEEVVRHLAAVCHLMAHELLEAAAQSAHNQEKATVSREDVESTWPYVVLKF